MKQKERIKNKKLMLVLVVATLLLVVAGISYAYFSAGGVSDKTITFRAGACLNITITEETDAISLNNVYPSTVEQGLNNTPYTFHIENMCPNEANYQISLESLNEQTNTLESRFLQASLEAKDGRRITNKLSEYDSITPTIENAYESRRLLSGTLQANETTYFSLRMWMDYDTLKEEGMNKIHSSKIVVSALNEKREDLDFFAITYTDESKEEGNNNWYKNYSTRVNITDSKSSNIKAKYCVGTTECIPNAEIELENNSYVYEYTNGTSILCTQAEDNLGNRSQVVCNEEVKIDTEAPSISYELGSNSLGSNNWYKNLDLIIKANDNKSEVSSLKYCVTTSETCTPSEIVNKDTASITLNTNLSSQKVCASAIDNNNNTSEVVCSNGYLVDTEVPTVNITSTSSTTNSVTINVSGSDTHSKIKTYYYSINNGTYQTGTTAKTYTGLNSGTNYTIKVYALDNAGNSSEIKTTIIKTQVSGKDLILSKNTVDTSRSSGTFIGTYGETTAGKIFSAQDDDGTTYFFAGSNPNNWVKFGQYTNDIYFGYPKASAVGSTNYRVYNSLEACQNSSEYSVGCSVGIKKGTDMYWRIVRINGDNSIRLIFNGTNMNSNIENTVIMGIEATGFSISYNKNAYVGYMYGNPSSNVYDEVHANTYDSKIKGIVDNWYKNYVFGQSFEQYIDTNAGFCGDRTINKTSTVWWDQDTKTGVSSNNTAYLGYYKMYYYEDKVNVNYKCNQKNDLYTLNSSSKGNKALTYPIGLITADEVIFAGGYVYGKTGSNTGSNANYLTSPASYWTMTPDYFQVAGSFVYYVTSGSVDRTNKSTTAYYVRPVINLKSDALTTGSGTTTDPYRIS